MSRNGTHSAQLRVGIVCDLLEERWFSMDLVANMLLEKLRSEHATGVLPSRICPAPPPRFARLPIFGSTHAAFSADRLAHRFWDYPRFLRRTENCDVFHIVDHSYAQLVHELPAERTVVTCHDLDTFRCVLDPAGNTRSDLFRRMTRRILSGLRKAARITCDSHATRDDLLAHGLCAPERAVVVPNGVHPACSPDPQERPDREAARLLGPAGEDSIDLLHVGSTIPRKRVDVLLRVFAAVRRERPDARLIRAGGRFTPEQQRLAKDLGIEDSIVALPHLDREVLAAVYRRAALVLLPSEAEGFGLPVAEALACGTPVVSTDLPVLREVGGEAAAYCPMGEVGVWRDTILDLLCLRSEQPDLWQGLRRAGIDRAAKFTWTGYTSQIRGIYGELANCNGSDKLVHSNS